MAGSSAQGLSSGSRRRRRRRGGRGPLSEINVTPLVDVMLVLLIVFMISAPLLTAGVPVELPKTEASALSDQNEPLTVSVAADGKLFVQDRPVLFAERAPRMWARSGEDQTRQVLSAPMARPLTKPWPRSWPACRAPALPLSV